MKKVVLLLVAVLLLVSCKTQYTVKPAGKASVDKKTKEIINHHLASFPTFKTLSGSLQVSYSDGDKQQSLPLSFRMEKDKAIWLSAPLGVAKVMITPEKVAYYNRLDSTSFSGDFSYISKLIGIEVGFTELQNLLLGNALYTFSYDSEGIITLLNENNNRYNVQIEDESPVRVVYRFLPETYRVETTLVQHIGTTQQAEATYTYQEVAQHILPLTLHLTVTNEQHTGLITLEFKNLSVDKELSFPFKIPDGMKPINK